VQVVEELDARFASFAAKLVLSTTPFWKENVKKPWHK
jgi:hypothetical protein